MLFFFFELDNKKKERMQSKRTLIPLLDHFIKLHYLRINNARSAQLALDCLIDVNQPVGGRQKYYEFDDEPETAPKSQTQEKLVQDKSKKDWTASSIVALGGLATLGALGAYHLISRGTDRHSGETRNNTKDKNLHNGRGSARVKSSLQQEQQKVTEHTKKYENAREDEAKTVSKLTTPEELRMQLTKSEKTNVQLKAAIKTLKLHKVANDEKLQQLENSGKKQLEQALAEKEQAEQQLRVTTAELLRDKSSLESLSAENKLEIAKVKSDMEETMKSLQQELNKKQTELDEALKEQAELQKSNKQKQDLVENLTLEMTSQENSHKKAQEQLAAKDKIITTIRESFQQQQKELTKQQVKANQDKKKIKSLENKLKKTVTETKKDKKSIDARNKQLRELTATNKQILEENAELKLKVANLTNSVATSQQSLVEVNNELQTKNTTLKITTEELRNAQQIFEQRMEELTSQKNTANEYKITIETLKQAVSKYKEKVIKAEENEKSLEARIEQLVGELIETKKQNLKEQELRQSLKAELEEIKTSSQAKITTLTTEQGRFKEELNTAQENLLAQDSKLKILRWDLEELQRKKELDDQIHNGLSESVGHLTMKVRELKDKNVDLGNFIESKEHALSSAKKKIEDLENNIKILKQSSKNQKKN